MTLSTSAVAVCCCSDSPRSSVRWRKFVEQACILDCYRSLIGEGLQQIDVLVLERAHLSSGGLGSCQARDPRGVSERQGLFDGQI